MNRQQLEHVIRAAALIVGDEIVVIGSQAILAEHPASPPDLLRSMEVDVYPRNKRDDRLSVEIDIDLGDSSQFASTYGYWAHGVGPETVIAPAGWEERLVRVEVPAALPSQPNAVAWCLSAHDLVLAKLAAHRLHDFAFAEEAIRARLVEISQLELGIDLLPQSVSWDVHKNPRVEARAALDGILGRLRRRGEA